MMFPEGVDPAPPRGSHRGLLAALVVAGVVVALLAGAGIYYLGTRAGSSAATGPASTPVTPIGTGSSATVSAGTSSGAPSVTPSAPVSITPSKSASGAVGVSRSTGGEPTSDPAGLTVTVTAAPPVTSKPTPPPPPKTVVVTTTTTKDAGPQIASFGESVFGGNAVDCGANPVVQLRFTWSAPQASTAWIGVDAGPDASLAPFYSDLPAVVGPANATTPFVEVPFSCSEPSHTYTLTVGSPGGKSSRTVTYQKAVAGPST